jgi:glycosyltransferase involved in cell wall biosynthesis
MSDTLVEKTPMVSVIMTTYNHEPYIKRAIEGVLMQETNFDVELILANDASPDNTDQIVRQLLENHPKRHWVKYTRHAENKGMKGNNIWAREQTRGKYLAYCEGDDYWIEPLKLQRQVDFMEANPNIVICGTKCIWDDGKGKKKLNEWKAGLVTLRDILIENRFATCTTMVRASMRKSLEINYTGFNAGDLPTWLSLLQKGDGYNLDFYGAVYLYHGGGSYSSQSRSNILRYEFENRLAMLRYVDTSLRFHLKWHSFILLLTYFARGLRFKFGYLKGIYNNRKLLIDFFFKH